MSSSMPDSRRVSLAPVNTLAPSGISSPMRARAAAASSRISTVKPCPVSAAAARSRTGSAAGSVYAAAWIGVVIAPPGLVVMSHQPDDTAPGNVRPEPSALGPGGGQRVEVRRMPRAAVLGDAVRDALVAQVGQVPVGG